ncbi:MAG: ATP-binding cassette domain-containing protein [Myxococcota bacterium]
MTPLIRFEGLVKEFGSNRVLDGVDLEVRRGEVHFVLGRSGAGKSVLLKHVVGLLPPTEGRVEYEGQTVAELGGTELRELRKRCQLIFQHPTLFEQLSVVENVAMPVRKRFSVSATEASERARAALERVDALEHAERYPPELGKGVQKRVSVARALALEPMTLLYDEPTTSLDPVSARRLDRTIRRMADESGMTSLVVSHDLASVETIADRVTFLDGGRVAFDGSLEAWRNSELEVVSRFRASAARWNPEAR